MKNKLFTLLGAIALIFGGVYTAFSIAQASFTPVQCAQTTLAGAGVGLTDTTILLTKFVTPGGNALTMSNFGSIGYMTLDPNSNSKVENISFTGIIQNSNGTAALTGVTRGLDFVSPYAASITLEQSHAGGSYAICSNPAVFYSQFPKSQNNETITGTWTFNAFPVTPSTPAATTLVAGFTTIGTSAQAASTTASASGPGSTTYVLPTSIATDTPTTSCTPASSKIGAGCIITANLNGLVSGLYGGTPAGSLIAYASTTAPRGWLLADGTYYATSTYPNLFSAIGYSYSTSSASTAINFAVPNLKYRSIMMASTTNEIGSTTGATSTTITQGNLPSYTLASNIIGTGSSNNGFQSGSSANTSLNTISTGGSGNALNISNPVMFLQYIIKY